MKLGSKHHVPCLVVFLGLISARKRVKAAKERGGLLLQQSFIWRKAFPVSDCGPW